MEPGARWNIEPCVAAPPVKPWRFTTPWKPLPLETPTTSTCSFSAKMSQSTLSPGAAFSSASQRTSPRVFAGGTPAFSKWPFAAAVRRRGDTRPTSPSWTASYPSWSFVLR